MKINRLLTILLLAAASLFLPAAGSPPTEPAPPEIQMELAAAFQSRLSGQPAVNSLTFDLFTPELDTAFTTPDGQSAVLWLALRDDTGRRLASEPGFALARRSGNDWQVLLPGDPGWDEILASLPVEMVPVELSPQPASPSPQAIQPAALSGYYLPFAAGTQRWLEGSISHFQNIPELGYPSCTIDYCRYAYDFTDSWHFPLLASKGGTVVSSHDACSDGNPTCTNFIVLYNAGDDAYQIYLHLAYGTIPDSLTDGTAVVRGQYLGDSDDTGYSTSQHVHFMVTNSIWMGNSGYYWGNSIDIRFADVSINNGTPRTCYEVTSFPIYGGATECLGNKADPRNPANDWFTSGNVGAYPPGGELTKPAAGAVVAVGTNPLMDVRAAVSDDVAVTAVRLVAKINQQWVEIGPTVTQPLSPGIFDWDVDLCAVAPFNGALEVALRAWDHEGNVSAALNPRVIQVDHACPPPTSQLAPAVSFDSTAVQLNWTASAGASGLSGFEVQWRSMAEAWNSANSAALSADLRSTWFIGQLGGAYAFRLRAIDANGQTEPWPANDAAETSVSLPAACIPDGFEQDDTPAQAVHLDLQAPRQANLCGPNDPDWFQINLPAQGDYFISAASLAGGAALKITVFGLDGVTVQASAQSGDAGQDAVVLARSLPAGIHTIKVEPLFTDLAGTGAQYRLTVTSAHPTYMPVIRR
jgi:hypothetical protein